MQHSATAAALLQQGKQLHQTGDIDAAQALYRKVLERVPDHPEALYLLGTALLQRGDAEEAVSHLERAARALRNEAPVVGNLAQAYFALGRYPQATDAFRKASRIDPRNVSFHVGAASATAMQGNLGEAEAALRRLADRFPGSALVWLNLGSALRDQKRPDDSLAAYARAIALDPRLAEAHNNRGGVLHALYRFDEAEQSYRACIGIDQHYIPARYNLASVLIDVGRFREAEIVCRDLIQRVPSSTMAHTFLGAALSHQGRLLEALNCYRTATGLAPQDAKVVENHAGALAEIGDLRGALKGFARALALDPDSASAREPLAATLLSHGRLADGWVHYECRTPFIRFRDAHPDVRLSRALPRELAGMHIVLLREQGLGDELFFLRFAPALAAAGARVTYRGSDKLRTLLARTGCVAEILGESASAPPADILMLLADLPHALSNFPGSQLPEKHAEGMESPAARTAVKIAVLWPPVPRPLRIEPLDGRLATMRQRLAETGSPPYIGITWRAGTPPREQKSGAEWGLQKEIGIEPLGTAMRNLPGTLIALQRNPESDEIALLSRTSGRPLHDFTDVNDDLENMLALLALLDEYICVSNTNTHLRAAAGRTARVLVPRPAEWRWMTSGASSPWFPGFSLYRQALDGEWGTALARLREDLDRAMAAKLAAGVR